MAVGMCVISNINLLAGSLFLVFVRPGRIKLRLPDILFLVYVKLFTQLTYFPMVSTRTNASVSMVTESCLACRVTLARAALARILKGV